MDRVRGFGPWDAGSNPARRIDTKNFMPKKKLLIIFFFCLFVFLFSSKDIAKARVKAFFLECRCSKTGSPGKFNCWKLDRNFNRISQTPAEGYRDRHCGLRYCFGVTTSLLNEIVYPCAPYKNNLSRDHDSHFPGSNQQFFYRCKSRKKGGTYRLDLWDSFQLKFKEVKGEEKECSPKLTCYGTTAGPEFFKPSWKVDNIEGKKPSEYPCINLDSSGPDPGPAPPPGPGPVPVPDPDPDSPDDDKEETDDDEEEKYVHQPGDPAAKMACKCHKDEGTPGETKCTRTGALVPCGRNCDDPTTNNNECCACNFCHIFLLIKRIIDFLSPMAAVVVVVMFLTGGIMFITAAGNPDKITKARKALTSAVIGFAIVLLSWSIVNIVIAFATGHVKGGIATIYGMKWNEINCDPDVPSGVFTPQVPSQEIISGAQEVLLPKIFQEEEKEGVQVEGDIGMERKGIGGVFDKLLAASSGNKTKEPIIERLNEVLLYGKTGFQNARFGSRLNLDFYPQSKPKTSTMGIFHDRETSFIVAVRAGNNVYRFPKSDQWYPEYGFSKAKDPETGQEIKFHGVGIEIQPDRQTMYAVHTDTENNEILYLKSNLISPFSPTKSLEDDDLKMSIAPFFYQEILIYNPTDQKQTGELLVSVDYANRYKKDGNTHILYYKNIDGGGVRALATADLSATWAIGEDNVFKEFYKKGALPGKANIEGDFRPGGIAVKFKVKPGEIIKKVFVYAGYNDKEVIRDEIINNVLKFYYTKFFKNVDEVIKYALLKSNRQEIMRKTTNFINSINNNENFKDPSTRWIFAQALHSYFANTYLLYNSSNPLDIRYYVSEGNCGFLSTVDVAHETGIFEGKFIPWALKLQLEEWKRYNQNNCNFFKLGYGCDGCGLFIQHDMGIGPSEDEKDKKGRVTSIRMYRFTKEGKMAIEENLNYVLLSYWYWKKTGDKNFISDNRIFIKNLLNYVRNRDLNKDGIIETDYCKINKKIEITDELTDEQKESLEASDGTTFDIGDENIALAKENLYISIKSFGAFVAGSEMMAALNDKSAAGAFKEYANNTKKTLESIFDKSYYNEKKYFPISLLSCGDRPSIVTFDGLTYLFLTNSENKQFKDFIKKTGKSLIFNIKQTRQDNGFLLIGKSKRKECNSNNYQSSWLSKTFNAATAVKYLIFRNQIQKEKENLVVEITNKAKELLIERGYFPGYADGWNVVGHKFETLYYYPRGVSIIGIMLVK